MDLVYLDNIPEPNTARSSRSGGGLSTEYAVTESRLSTSTTASHRVIDDLQFPIETPEQSTDEEIDAFMTPPRGSLSFKNIQVQPFEKRQSIPYSPNFSEHNPNEEMDFAQPAMEDLNLDEQSENDGALFDGKLRFTPIKTPRFDADRFSELLSGISTPRSRLINTTFTSPQPTSPPATTPRRLSRKSTADSFDSPEFDGDIRWEMEDEEFFWEPQTEDPMSDRSSVDLASQPPQTPLHEADTPVPKRRMGSTGISLTISTSGSAAPSEVLETPRAEDEYTVIFPTQMDISPPRNETPNTMHTEPSPKSIIMKHRGLELTPRESEEIESPQQTQIVVEEAMLAQEMMELKNRLEMYEKWFDHHGVDPSASSSSLLAPFGRRQTAQKSINDHSVSSTWSGVTVSETVSLSQYEELLHENAKLRMELRAQDAAVEHAVNELGRLKVDSQLQRKECEHLNRVNDELSQELDESERLRKDLSQCYQKILESANTQFEVMRRKLMA